MARAARVERKFEAIGLKLWVDYACWLFCDVFPRWRGAVLSRKFVRRMQRVCADLAVRGATRQWLTKVTAAAKAFGAEAAAQLCQVHAIVVDFIGRVQLFYRVRQRFKMWRHGGTIMIDWYTKDGYGCIEDLADECS